MQLETLLPLGKVDPSLRAPETPLDLSAIAADARLLEGLGYTGLVVEETKDDPFVIMALAAQATTRLKLGTAVAIAFPRSPTVWRSAPGRFRSSARVDLPSVSAHRSADTSSVAMA